jgi:hypothetical protein
VLSSIQLKTKLSSDWQHATNDFHVPKLSRLNIKACDARNLMKCFSLRTGAALKQHAIAILVEGKTHDLGLEDLTKLFYESQNDKIEDSDFCSEKLCICDEAKTILSHKDSAFTNYSNFLTSPIKIVIAAVKAVLVKAVYVVC